MLSVVDETVVSVAGADLGRQLVDSVCSVYDEVFSAPPFFWRHDESALHRDRLLGLFDDPTFGISVAMHGSELAGFAYGFTVPADTQRWTRLMEPVDADTATEWPGRTFMLFDYAVLAAIRGRGVGTALHDRLLGSRPEQRATLAVQPTAMDTKRIYEHLGWRMVGRMPGGPTAAAPFFDCYVRDSLDDLRAKAPTGPGQD